ncbi:MAG: nucleoside deaminase [Vampirovibrionales bacterium]
MSESVINWANWMQHCLQLANQALPLDVPVGAVLLSETGELLGEGFNTRERDQNPLGHAELNALQQASQRLGQWRHRGSTVVVTLEPCPMCASALAQAGVRRIVYGASDAHMGGCGGWLAAHAKPSPPQIVAGILESACQAQLQQFFTQLRQSS